MKSWKGNKIENIEKNQIFVFGSNPEGRHGAGAAKVAILFGAKYGKGRGLHGQTYALITKNLTEWYIEKETGIQYEKQGYKSVSEEQIRKNIDDLYICAKENPDKEFLMGYQYETWPNGSPKKSLNGYDAIEFLKMFIRDNIPENIVFHETYTKKIEELLGNKSEKENKMNTEKKYTFFFHLSSPFSNFHPSPFNFKGLQFVSNEQFIMYCKAKLFKDDNNAEKIMSVNDQEDICKKLLSGEITKEQIVKDKDLSKQWNEVMKFVKKCGREVKNYDDKIWEQKRVNVAGVGAKEKFTQILDLKKTLLDTEGTFLVEASPYDKIWGIGLNASDAKATPESEWPGLNLLGKNVLDRVRALIIKEEKELKQESKKKFKP